MKIKFLLCMALAITLFSCGKDDEPWNDDANGQSNSSSVVINADGSTSTGVSFSMLDGTTFYLDYIKYKIVDSHLEIVGYDKTEIADDVRPYAYVTLNGTKYNTRVIASGAFNNCEMRSLSIPSTVQKAFVTGDKLSNILIPNSVTILDLNGRVLTEIVIPNSVITLHLTCPKLTELTIPNSVKYLSVPGCSGLTEITIPESVTSIGDRAFSGCTSLTEIIIPNPVTFLGGQFFEYCTNLKKIVLPEKIDYFYWDWIYGCDSLSDIYIGECDRTDYSSYYKPITFHVKSDCVEKMTRKLNPYGRNNIVVVGDYSSSIK